MVGPRNWPPTRRETSAGTPHIGALEFPSAWSALRLPRVGDVLDLVLAVVATSSLVASFLVSALELRSESRSAGSAASSSTLLDGGVGVRLTGSHVARLELRLRTALGCLKHDLALALVDAFSAS